MKKITYACAIALALFSSASYAMSVLAQPASNNKPANNGQLRFTPPPLPPSGTPAGRRRGAAGRGDCNVNLPLTALVPSFKQNQREVTYVWAKTLAEYPTFWFYLPDSRPPLNSVEFVLQDEQDNDVYRTQVSLPEKSGIVSVRLPSTATPLTVNQNYHWFFKIAGKDSCKDFVEGWVQRVNPNPNLISQLKAATPKQRVELYATNGLWFDAVTTLAELRLRQPGDTILKAKWEQLLQSEGLGYIASKPIVKCCSVKNNYKQLSD